MTPIFQTVGGIGGHSIHAVKQGSKKVKVRQADGTDTERVLKCVKYCPKAKENLFAVNLEMSTEGAKMSSNDTNDLVLTYPNGDRIVADRRANTKDGWVGGVEITDVSDNTALATVNHHSPNKAAHNSANINTFHNKLGHPDMVTTMNTAKKYGIVLRGPERVCESCLIGKARQKGVRKIRIERSSIAGERLFIDISSTKVRTLNGTRYWLLALDDYSDMLFSFFLRQKSDLVHQLVDFIKCMRDVNNIKIQIIRGDNAGENKKFETIAKREGLSLSYEYTAPNTPQQNGRVERKFPHLYGMMRSMTLGSDLPKEKRDELWDECARTATDLHNITVRSGQTESPFTKFFGKGMKSHVDMTKIYGEKCIVADVLRLRQS